MVRYTLEYNSNSLIVDSHGATIVSGCVNGYELFFLSEKAFFDGKTPIRGGVPIVFPNFGHSSEHNLPKHGFARISQWSLEKRWNNLNNSGIILKLETNSETLKFWNYKFKLLYTITLNNNNIMTELFIQNQDPISFNYQCLFHNYFKVSNLKWVRIANLDYIDYYDQLTHKISSHSEEILINQEIDRVYGPTNNCVSILDTEYVLKVNSDENQFHVVVWNPWEKKSKSLSDFGDEEFLDMVCVELGKLDSCKLKPWETKSFKQTITMSGIWT